MKYNPEVYRRAIYPQIERWLKARPHETPISQMPYIALATMCPILVVAQFIGEISGFDDELRRQITVMEKFYQ